MSLFFLFCESIVPNDYFMTHLTFYYLNKLTMKRNLIKTNIINK